MNKEKIKFYWNLIVFIMCMISISIRIVQIYYDLWINDWFHWGTLIACSLGAISSYIGLRKYIN